jgi:cell division protein FtsQ
VRAAAAATLRTIPRAALAIPATLRRRLLIALGALVVIWSLYHFWFRDSSFVKVEHVKVRGVNARDSDQIKAALINAAHDMTTMHVRKSALMAAVADYTAVKDLVVQPHFPHSLTIKVIQEQPVALLRVGGKRMLLAADGSVLSGIRQGGHPLAAIRSTAAAPSSRLTDPVALAELRVAAAAPPALARRIATVGRGSTRGIVVKLAAGPQLIFGDDSLLDAKWAAAAGVLADSSSKGASYVDVRLPERPVAGTFSVSSLQPLDTAGAQAAAANAQTTVVTPSQGTSGATGPVGTTGASGTTGLQAATTNPQP